ncbi:HAD ATPase, P-type, family IC [Lachnospiraceae bacterium MD308]|nr:HAD ATPase, P-type, family IC [Lachnospiraceae bacterium MD308]
MLKIEIPNYKTLELEYLVLDYNGTIALDGEIRDSVRERLITLSKELEIYVLTADTHGTAKKMCEGLPLKIQTFPTDGALDEKLAVVEGLGEDRCIAIGNGRNDKLMCRASALAIAVMEQEGMCGRLLGEADVCTRNIEDALDLLLRPKRLIATLRG